MVSLLSVGLSISTSSWDSSDLLGADSTLASLETRNIARWVSPETKELGHEQMLMELQDSGIEPLHRHFQIKYRIMSQELCLGYICSAETDLTTTYECLFAWYAHNSNRNLNEYQVRFMNTSYISYAAHRFQDYKLSSFLDSLKFWPGFKSKMT